MTPFKADAYNELMTSAIEKICFFLLVSLMVGCLPKHLDKYRNKKASASEPVNGSSLSSSNEGAKKQATIYAVDKQTFRIHLRGENVWKASLDVLLKNYNITILDKDSGLITTEWDTYYLNNQVFRNKVSMRMNRVSWNVIELTILNNVEVLRENDSGVVSNVWLPARDEAGETSRIIQNIALLLNQPPPVMPPSSNVAKDPLRESQAVGR